MKKTVFGFLCILFTTGLSAQSNATSAEIYLGLKKLNVLGSVLYVAAHPDDENTRLLAYFSKERLYRTGYLSLTRGDGGQNLIGDEQGVELGLIRTQELLAARRIDGAEQFFTRAYDFGFSKTPEETFDKWNKEKILADVVWAIRQFQPDVIITRFPTTGEGGHGHHTASAILANEAFTAAADPNRFPEQLRHVGTWQAKRILWNSFNFGGNNTQREDQFKFDVGGYNAVLGKSYGEIAAESRSLHKSQGFGVPASRGEALEYFQPTGGAPLQTDLFNDVNLSWQRVPGAEKVQALIEKAIAEFDFVQPQKSVASLVNIYKALSDLPRGYWRDAKLKETKNLIEQASGLWLEAFTQQPYAVQSDSVRVQFAMNNRLDAKVMITGVSIQGFDTSMRLILPRNKTINWNKSLYVTAHTEPTQPYWLKQKMTDGSFVVNEQQLIGRPESTPYYRAAFFVTIENLPMVFEKPVQYKYTDPVRGELYQPLNILPPVSINNGAEVKVLTKPSSINGMIELKANRDNVKAKVFTDQQLIGKDEKRIDYPDGSLSLTKGITELPYKANFTKSGSYFFYVRDSATGMLSIGRPKEIKYDHIPTQLYYADNAVNVQVIDLKTKGKTIGYITGAGDKVPEALEQMGYDVTLLTDKELSRNNLQRYDAIISGVRAYNTNEWLNKHYDKLMKYVAGGGNLVVQYNTNNGLGPLRTKIGPYPFTISRNRVTDENAAVQFLKPAHAVLNYPNKITADDFKGWIQERSIYHATEMDKRFETILSMHDAGEKPDEGSLIIAPHGKGFFTYTGLVFFRELPAGVPGAYRLLANIIALNQKKEM